MRYDVTDLFLSYPEQVRELQKATGGNIVAVRDDEKIRRKLLTRLSLDQPGATSRDVVNSWVWSMGAEKAQKIPDLESALREGARSALSKSLADFRRSWVEDCFGEDDPLLKEVDDHLKQVGSALEVLRGNPTLVDFKINQEVLSALDELAAPPWEYYKYFLV